MYEYRKVCDEKVAVVDFDHTLLSQESPLNCWLYPALEKIIESENTKWYTRLLSKIVKKVAKHSLEKNPNKDPKRYEMWIMGNLARGVLLEDTYIGVDKLPENKILVDVLINLKKEEYKIIIVSASPEEALKHWSDSLNKKYNTQIIDDIYGLKLKVKEGKIKGLDMNDPYTKITLKKGISEGKDFAYADIMNRGNTLIYTIGNSPGDKPNNTKMRKYTDKEISIRHIGIPFGEWSESTKLQVEKYVLGPTKQQSIASN